MFSSVPPSVLPFPPSVSRYKHPVVHSSSLFTMPMCRVPSVVSHPSLMDFKPQFTAHKVAIYIKGSRCVSGHTCWMMQY